MIGAVQIRSILCAAFADSTPVFDGFSTTWWSLMRRCAELLRSTLEPLVCMRVFVCRGLLAGDAARAMAHWQHDGGFSVDAGTRAALILTPLELPTRLPSP